MVLRGGENIYCAEVEAAIYEHPAVYEAAVFGLPDERLGEEVACHVMVKPGGAFDRRRAAGSSSASGWRKFKVPTRVAIVERTAAPQRVGQDPQAAAPRRRGGRVERRGLTSGPESWPPGRAA